MTRGGQMLVKGGEGMTRGGQKLATLLEKVHLGYSVSLEKQGGINHTVHRKEGENSGSLKTGATAILNSSSLSSL